MIQRYPVQPFMRVEGKGPRLWSLFHHHWGPLTGSDQGRLIWIYRCPENYGFVDLVQDPEQWFEALRTYPDGDRLLENAEAIQVQADAMNRHRIFVASMAACVAAGMPPWTVRCVHHAQPT